MDCFRFSRLSNMISNWFCDGVIKTSYHNWYGILDQIISSKFRIIWNLIAKCYRLLTLSKIVSFNFLFIKVDGKKRKTIWWANWNTPPNDKTIEAILVNINSNNSKKESELFLFQELCVSPLWPELYVFHFPLCWSAGTFNYLTFKAHVLLINGFLWSSKLNVALVR